MDHDRFVSIKIPSSVSASKSSNDHVPGSKLTFVIRIIGNRFQLSVRIVPEERFSPTRCAVSRFERYPRNCPALMMSVPWSVIEPRIGHHVHNVRRIAKFVELIEGEETGPGKIRFLPQHAVQLNRMSHRFMN